jgi:D-3-phosphoglycerate dehydrogenase
MGMGGSYMKILIADFIAEQGIEILRAEHDVHVRTNLTENELLDIIGDYDGLIVRSDTKVTEDVIESGKRLKIIGMAGVGVDHIDVPAATKRGIIVANTPEENIVSTSEHTIAMMLALSRNIPQADASLKANRWDRERFIGNEIKEKTLGIIGLGRIGIEVVKRAHHFEMNIIAYDPFISDQRAKELGIELKNLDTVLKNSDYITIHTPLTSGTRNLISDPQFAIMKKGVRIINCARGGIINEDALIRAIDDGRVSGAALDVFAREPPSGSPLLESDLVIVTPHLGASTIEAQTAVSVAIAGQVLAALHGEIVQNAINLPSIRPGVMDAMRSVAESTGSLCAQIVQDFDVIEIEYAGRLFDTDIRMITHAALKGVLATLLGSGVNYVNAPELAKERKIKIKESKAIAAEIQSITIRLKGTVVRSVTSVFENDRMRIIGIDGCGVDIFPSRYMIVSRHQNRPNIIGPCCTILGRDNINISAMQVSCADGTAIMIMSVDSDIPPHVLEEIREVDGIIDAVLIYTTTP